MGGVLFGNGLESLSLRNQERKLERIWPLRIQKKTWNYFIGNLETFTKEFCRNFGIIFGKSCHCLLEEKKKKKKKKA